MQPTATAHVILGTGQLGLAIMDHNRFVAAFGDISTPHAQASVSSLAWFQAQPR